jgi:thioredoxin-like negative regulator of GroEL
VTAPEELEHLISAAPGVLVYFTGPDCSVCEVLRPRVGALLAQRFPRLQARLVDCAALPAVAARHRVLTVPTVLAFFEGREWVRKSRSFALGELEAALDRPYALLFEDTP